MITCSACCASDGISVTAVAPLPIEVLATVTGDVQRPFVAEVERRAPGPGLRHRCRRGDPYFGATWGRGGVAGEQRVDGLPGSGLDEELDVDRNVGHLAEDLTDRPGVGGLDPLPPQVAVEVRDDGPGMGPDDLERIFSPFFTTKPQGTGLGLAIVRKVVDAHDGRITAVSAPGRGAAFKVTLPVVPSVRSMGR